MQFDVILASRIVLHMFHVTGFEITLRVIALLMINWPEYCAVVPTLKI